MKYNKSFGTSADYSELNNGLHRRSAVKLKPPLLTWHLSFWRRNLENSTSNIGLTAQDSKSRDKIDEFIIAFYKHVLSLHRNQKPDSAEKIGAPTLHSARAGKAILLNHILNMPELDHPRHRDDLYDVVTGRPLSNYLFPIQRDVFESSYRDITIEFEWKRSKVCVRIEPHTEFVTVSFFVNLRGDNDIVAMLDGGGPDGSGATMEAGRALAADRLYSSFWTDFSKVFLTGQDLENVIDGTRHHPPIFGQVFGEFRGVVLAVPEQQQTAAGSGWGRTAIQAMLPLINNAAAPPTECCANYFFKNRVLYMSTLGSQNLDTEEDERVPVHYMMKVPSEIDPWQLGRLVLRLNFLGTLRLAAIRSLSGLLKAGRILTELEPLIKAARDEVSRGKHDQMATAVKAANAKFDTIHETDPEILFRIERSRYYVQQFTENVAALRIGRLEGYQKYDDFVRRRLGATIDFIDRLGKRYERAATNLALLQQYAFSSTANVIADRATTIAKGGEAALFLFLIPYYFTSFSRELAGNNAAIFYVSLSTISMIIGGKALFETELFVKIHHKTARTLMAVLLAVVSMGLLIYLNQYSRDADKKDPLVIINRFLSAPTHDPAKPAPSQPAALTSPQPAAGSPPRPGG